ncbi:MAG: tetratricopeptide repeat protein, partial [Bacteroidales bacterium]|nr:tetratricopeptide repeat protein [Bacteroidales bacterium]
MKTLLITISVAFAMLMMISNVQAQKKYVNKAMIWAESGEKLDTALKAVEFAETQEKTKDWAKTYYVKGLVYNAIASSTDPDYANICESPSVKAFESFKKAYNMDGSNMYQSAMDIQFITMANDFVKKAIDTYNAEDFENAFLYFEKTLEVKKMKVFEGEIDTAIIFNAAITAQRIGKFEKAVVYYNKSIEYDYAEGDAFSLLAGCYKEQGDNENYVNTLKSGFEKYPSNQSVLGSIINYYLLEEENAEEAFKYLALARENDPTNPQFYSAEAHLYDKTGDKETAKEKYKKAIEIDENFFEAYYNLGVLYFNEGVELTDIANQIVDNAKYQEAKAVADKKFEEALHYIEKSHELKPDDRSIMSTLKTLY